jgi:hypothetical protein
MRLLVWVAHRRGRATPAQSDARHRLPVSNRETQPVCYRSPHASERSLMSQDALAAALILLIASLTVASALLSLLPRPGSPLGEARRLWSIALLFAPMGWMLLELGSLLGLALLSLFAKAAIVIAFAVFLGAISTLRGSPMRLYWHVLPVAFVASASLWVYWNAPYAPMRTGLLSLVCAVLALRGAWLAGSSLTRLHCPRAAGLLAAFALSAALMSVRGVMLLSPGNPEGGDPAGVASVLLGIALLAPLLATGCLFVRDASRSANPDASRAAP